MQKKQLSDARLLSMVQFLIHSLFCTFAFLVICGFGNISHSDTILVLFTLLVSTATFFAFQFKISRRILLSISIATASVLVIGDVLGFITSQNFRLANAFYNILIAYSSGRGELLLLFFIALFISIYSFYFAVFNVRPVAVATFCGLIFILQLVSGGRRSTVYFIFLIAVMLLIIFIKNYIRADTASFLFKTGAGKVSLFALLTVAISIAISTLLPYPDAPLIENSLNSASRGNLSYYSFGSDKEYEEASKLGGKLDLKDDEIFTVRTKNRIKLIGSIKTEYTGNSWRFGDRTSAKYFGGASDDFVQVAYGFDFARKYDALIFNNAEITPHGLSTHTVFIPPLLSALDIPTDVSLYLADDGSLTSSSERIDATYTVDSAIVDVNNEEIQSVLSGSQKDAYKKLKGDPESGLTKNQLINKTTQAYNFCLALPNTLPDRVRNLADEITKNCKTDYDKIVAIHRYLSDYKYTTTPTDLPDNTDFVDYFLFEQKEGYCSYYASAMAILSRCVGVPSRYVEGYALPADFKGDADARIYTVTGRQAHSWVQIYFDGVGWIDFEPTPPYDYLEQGLAVPSEIFQNEQDIADFTQPSDENPSDDEIDATEAPTEPTDYTENTTEYNNSDTQNQDLNADKNPQIPFTQTVWFKLLMALCGCILILAGVIAFSLIMHFTNKKSLEKIERQNNTEAIKGLYKKIEYVYSICNICRKPDETVGDFLHTSSAILSLDCTCDEIIERAFYSDEEITDTEFDAVKSYYLKQRTAVKHLLTGARRFLYSNLLHRL